MSAARPEHGAARLLLLLAVVAGSTGLAWLALQQGRHLIDTPCVEPGAPYAAAPRRPSSDLKASVRGPAGGASSSRRGDAPAAAAVLPSRGATAKLGSGGEPEWLACLDRGDDEHVWNCLSAHLDPRPEASEIGRLLCRGGGGAPASQALFLAAALDRIPPELALAWLREIEVSCPRFVGWNVLEQACDKLRVRDPLWLARLLATLTPDRVFGAEAGESGLLLSARFLEKGDLAFQDWIERGARGEWGGSTEQIERALGVALGIERSPESRLAFLRSVLESSSTPGEGSLGSTFVQELLCPRTLAGGDEAGALEALDAVLGDPRFKDGAAATICLRYHDEAPAGCDAASWSAFRARALGIARGIGLVIPGER